ncbi:Ig-like domain-containing protein [Candidatus Aenigmatarchaeota archaeon]
MRIASIIMIILLISMFSSQTYANEAPVFNEIDDIEDLEGAAITFTVYAVDTDELTYSATYLPRGATFDSESRRFYWIPDYDQSGGYYVKFRVVDEYGKYDAMTVRITVVNVNHPPNIISVMPSTRHISRTTEGSILRFFVNAVDPDEDNLKYVWYLDGEKKYSSGSSFEYEADFDDAGTHTLRVTVSDKEYELYEEWEFEVSDRNRAPRITGIRDRRVKEDELVKFTISAEDDDKDDVLIITTDDLPVGAGFDSITGEFTWIPDYGQAGTYRIYFRVKDQHGYTHTQRVKITVEESEEYEEKKRAGTLVGEKSSPGIGSSVNIIGRTQGFSKSNTQFLGIRSGIRSNDYYSYQPTSRITFDSFFSWFR